MKHNYRPVAPSLNLPPIKKADPDEQSAAHIAEGKLHPETKFYTMGPEIKIMICPPFMKFGWFMEMIGGTRYPTSDEIFTARFILLPQDTEFMMRIPTTLQYFDDFFSLTFYEGMSAR